MTVRSVGLESNVDLRAVLLSDKLQGGQTTCSNKAQSREQQHLRERKKKGKLRKTARRRDEKGCEEKSTTVK